MVKNGFLYLPWNGTGCQILRPHRFNCWRRICTRNFNRYIPQPRSLYRKLLLDQFTYDSYLMPFTWFHVWWMYFYNYIYIYIYIYGHSRWTYFFMWLTLINQYIYIYKPNLMIPRDDIWCYVPPYFGWNRQSRGLRQRTEDKPQVLGAPQSHVFPRNPTVDFSAWFIYVYNVCI